MKKFASTGGALALCLMSAACASHGAARMEARDALANPADQTRVETAAVSSFYWGDKWTAANLYERAQVQDGDTTRGSGLINRFNLATTYQNTGRFAEAADLYRSVQADGGSIRAVEVKTDANRIQRTRHFNLADEATARLAVLDKVAANRVAANRAAFSNVRTAESAGTPASAVVGTPLRGRVSDETAIRRDAAAQPLP